MAPAATSGSRARAGDTVPGRAAGTHREGRCPRAVPSLPVAVRPRNVSYRRWSLGLGSVRRRRAELSLQPVTRGAQASLLPTLTHHRRLGSTFRPRTPALQQAQLQEIPSGVVQSSWRLAAGSRPRVSVPCKCVFFVLKGCCWKAAVTPGDGGDPAAAEVCHAKHFNTLMAPCHVKASTAVTVFMCFSVAECGIMWAMRS